MCMNVLVYPRPLCFNVPCSVIRPTATRVAQQPVRASKRFMGGHVDPATLPWPDNKIRAVIKEDWQVRCFAASMSHPARSILALMYIHGAHRSALLIH